MDDEQFSENQVSDSAANGAGESVEDLTRQLEHVSSTLQKLPEPVAAPPEEPTAALVVINEPSVKRLPPPSEWNLYTTGAFARQRAQQRQRKARKGYVIMPKTFKLPIKGEGDYKRERLQTISQAYVQREKARQEAAHKRARKEMAELYARLSPLPKNNGY